MGILLQGAEPRERGMSGFTVSGGIYVLVNALLLVSGTINQACGRMASVENGDGNFVLNSELYLCILTLQSLLDGFASLCYRIHKPSGIECPDQKAPVIYFDDFNFNASDLVWVQKLQTEIKRIIYKSVSFNDFANFVKHEQPYIGTVKTSVRKGWKDVFDDSDIGVMYDVIIPVYKHLKGMLSRLALSHDVSLPPFPII